MNSTLRKTARQEFIDRLHEIADSDLRRKIQPPAGQTPLEQVTDQALFSAKKISDVTFTDAIFKSDDSKVDGLRNVALAKTPTGKYFLVNKLVLQSKASAELADAVFTDLATDVMQGEIEITVDKKAVVSRMPISALFPEVDGNGKWTGVTFLDNPKMLPPDKDIIVRMWFPKALAANTCIKLALVGCANDNN